LPSAADWDTLPPPAEITAEIVDSLGKALEKFRLVDRKLAGG
jgi:type I restriction enzyme M protein